MYIKRSTRSFFRSAIERAMESIKEWIVRFSENSGGLIFMEIRDAKNAGLWRGFVYVAIEE